MPCYVLENKSTCLEMVMNTLKTAPFEKIFFFNAHYRREYGAWSCSNVLQRSHPGQRVLAVTVALVLTTASALRL